MTALRRSHPSRPVTPRVTYMREYQRRWWTERRAFWVELMGGACVWCGSSENLEFDHKDPASKSFNIRVSMNHRRLLPELLKCQLLCSDCHKYKQDNFDTAEVPF